MSQKPGRTVQRRLLGGELRRLRESAGLTIEEVASFVRMSTSVISKIENGKQAILPRNVTLLALCYKLDEELSSSLIRRAEEMEKPPGLSRALADTVPGWFDRYADLEGDASAITSYDSELIPGLLQTADYITAITRASRPNVSDEEVSRAVESRQQRQRRILVPGGPALRVIINEAALLRLVGDSGVMRRQVQHLSTCAEQADIRILPLSVGAHPAMGMTFLRLAFTDSDLDFVYLEADCGAFYLEDANDVVRYDALLERVSDIALTREDSASWLATVVRQE
ncbi:DNA binding protein with helix-turn-helix domain [Actinoalloteichus sp. GBA129-24]|uniref:DNA binding protein with helix-turn-helix domain n=2 Tax=Actinoalloteichus TaxID=65496 RepID=A0AAC9PTF7_9PSEU|nr:helix-turn-helix transcriptional regulator [Actinoalloteichus fjordicus]APU16624.1 DNA binding protein with helix-turn-helix domain [Actinoalloteichus fjordicus]APU22690.1 DNA binding protein with helix-turn-helix domain [Actinoalloteichus sp. GBA129-24]